MNVELLINALVVAAVTAGATGYVNGVITKTRVNGMKEEIKALTDEIKLVRQRLHDWAGHIAWVDLQRRSWDGDNRRSR